MPFFVFHVTNSMSFIFFTPRHDFHSLFCVLSHFFYISSSFPSSIPCFFSPFPHFVMIFIFYFVFFFTLSPPCHHFHSPFCVLSHLFDISSSVLFCVSCSFSPFQHLVSVFILCFVFLFILLTCRHHF